MLSPRGLCLTLTSSRSFVLCCSVDFRTCWYSLSFCSSSSNNLQGEHNRSVQEMSHTDVHIFVNCSILVFSWALYRLVSCFSLPSCALS